jgi:hypothetical protein
MIVGYVIIDTVSRKMYAEDDASGGYMYWTPHITSARVFNTPENAQERIDFWWRPSNVSYTQGTSATITPVEVRGL